MGCCDAKTPAPEQKTRASSAPEPRTGTALIALFIIALLIGGTILMFLSG